MHACETFRGQHHAVSTRYPGFRGMSTAAKFQSALKYTTTGIEWGQDFQVIGKPILTKKCRSKSGPNR